MHIHVYAHRCEIWQIFINTMCVYIYIYIWVKLRYVCLYLYRYIVLNEIFKVHYELCIFKFEDVS